MELEDVVNKICSHIPEGYIINLSMENGAAFVELYKSGKQVCLPDPADKTLIVQLNDALCASKGFVGA